MKRYATAYVGTAAVMLLLDALWIGLIAQPLYAQQLGHLLADEPRFGVAALFYLLYTLGVVIFAVAPHSGGAPWKTTLGRAALFGFFAYATYDLTNLATLRGWPLGLSLIDIAWGTFISTASAAGGKAAMDRWARAAG